MANMPKCTTSYHEIPSIESNTSMEEWIQLIGAASLELAGRMKHAFEKANKQMMNAGYFDGYQNGYENGYAARGLDDL